MQTNEDLDPAAVSTAQFAEEVFIGLHRMIVAEESGARAGEVEPIHDMRVAIRRLRVALSNFSFCLPRGDRRRIRARLEALAGALGEVRDLDLMIAALKESLVARAEGDRHAIGSLIRRLQRRRRRQYLSLVNYLDGEEYASFKGEFSSLDRFGQPGQPGQIDGGDEQTEHPQTKHQGTPLSEERRHGQAA